MMTFIYGMLFGIALTRFCFEIAELKAHGITAAEGEDSVKGKT